MLVTHVNIIMMSTLRQQYHDQHYFINIMNRLVKVIIIIIKKHPPVLADVTQKLVFKYPLQIKKKLTLLIHNVQCLFRVPIYRIYVLFPFHRPLL